MIGALATFRSHNAQGFGLLLATVLLMQTAVFTEHATAQIAPPANRQFIYAHGLFRRGEVKLSVEAFARFVQDYPDDDRIPDARYFLALLARLDGDLRLAANHLSMVRGDTMVVPEHLVNLVRGKVATELARHKEALGHLNKIDLPKLKATTRAEVWLARAACHQGLKNHEAVLDSLIRASEIESPHRARAFLYRAGLEEQLGRRDNAIKSLENCLELDDMKVTAEAAGQLGELHYKQRQFKQAIERYEQVLRDFPNSPGAPRVVVATMWAQLKGRQYDALLKTHQRYNRTLATDEATEALYLAGSAHMEKRQCADATAIFQVILTQQRGWKLEDRVLYKTAVCQFHQHAYKRMGETIDRLRRTHRESNYVQDGDMLLAKAQAQQGHVNEAAASFTAIIEAGDRHRKYAEALRQRGWLYEKHKQFDAAIGDYNRYLGEGHAPSRAIVHDTVMRLIDLYARTDRHEKCLTTTRRLLDTNATGNGTLLEPKVEQEALYRWALAARKLRQHEQVHEALSTLMQRHPLNPFRNDALFFDGLALISLGKHPAGVAVLQQALKSEDMETAKRIDALRLSAVHFRDTNREDDAVEMLLEVDEHSKEKGLLPDERLWLGKQLYTAGRYKPAIGFLESLNDKALPLPAEMRAEAIMYAARSHRALRQYEPAVSAYKSVIALGVNGLDLEAWQEQADTLFEAEQYDDALHEYLGLIGVSQTRVASRAYFQAARTYRALAVESARLEDKAAVVQANTDTREMLLRTIILYSDKRLSPLPQQAHISLAEIERILDQSERSLKAYKDLAAKFPDGAYAVFARAMVTRASGDGEQARALLLSLDREKLDDYLLPRVEGALGPVGKEP